MEGTATGKLNQWALGGDTWIVGVDIPYSGISRVQSIKSDMIASATQTKSSSTAIYQKNCGLASVTLHMDMMNIYIDFLSQQKPNFLGSFDNCEISQLLSIPSQMNIEIS